MRLSNEELTKKADWEKIGVKLPDYDREKMIERTKENPRWVHFGAGNIFRIFHAAKVDTMLDKGTMDTGIIVVEGYDYEIIDKIYRPYDNLSLAATFKADGSIDKRVIGSVAESLCMDPKRDADMDRIREIFKNPSLQMATFTITEKGYAVRNMEGALYPWISDDCVVGPEEASSTLGIICALLYLRYLTGAYPIAMVSTDNCSHNGDKLRMAMEIIARMWEQTGRVMPGFVDYITDPHKVAFPITMIDKITPSPHTAVQQLLEAQGLRDIGAIVTEKHSSTAPFVNAEETEYLIIEDTFPNGRPDLESSGIMVTNRATVEKVENMKVSTCLNPLHTALAIFGCLLGYDRISEEMKNDVLVHLIANIGYVEGMPVVVNPGIIDPFDFLDTVIQVRLPNPFMPDSPQRIATDTSQKLAVRFGETIKRYQMDGKDMDKLVMIPLTIAGWFRYLMGIDDQGRKMPLSPDPMMDDLQKTMKKVSFGVSLEYIKIKPLLSNTVIFGVDLDEAGLADRICGYFDEMNAGPGAVSDTLRKYVLR